MSLGSLQGSAADNGAVAQVPASRGASKRYGVHSAATSFNGDDEGRRLLVTGPGSPASYDDSPSPLTIDDGLLQPHPSTLGIVFSSHQAR